MDCLCLGNCGRCVRLMHASAPAPERLALRSRCRGICRLSPQSCCRYTSQDQPCFFMHCKVHRLWPWSQQRPSKRLANQHRSARPPWPPGSSPTEFYPIAAWPQNPVLAYETAGHALGLSHACSDMPYTDRPQDDANTAQGCFGCHQRLLGPEAQDQQHDMKASSTFKLA